MVTLLLGPGTAQADTVILTPVTDARILSVFADSNEGFSPPLSVYNDGGSNVQRSLVKFDLSALPPKVRLKSATLRLVETDDGYSSNGQPTYLGRATTDWIEGEVTWEQARSGVEWNSGSGGDFTTAYTSANSLVDQTLRCDATQIVKEWLDGSAPNYGFFLWAPVNNKLHFFSREISVNQSGDRPQLIVEFDGSSGNTEKWARRYDGPSHGEDRACGAATDSQGNVLVAGRSGGGRRTGYDYATVKYDSSGQRLWTKRYNGPANRYDIPVAIAVDAEDNVVVTGFSIGLDMSVDFATVKYDAHGNELWSRRYSDPTGNEDVAISLAVDLTGNVIVSGHTGKVKGDVDYLTVRYDAQGNETWAKRYNGPVGGLDLASAVAVDAKGNVVVTGTSEGLGTGADYATVKYDSKGGELWVRRFDNGSGASDGATAVGVDTSGSVFVTGTSTGQGGSTDYATVKYAPGGRQLWVGWFDGPERRDDAPSALAVDGNGNVVVTGNSLDVANRFSDYATVKYAADGSEQWTRTYSGSGESDDQATAIVVDANGDIVVTGRSNRGAGDDFGTVKYDSAGSRLWVASYDGRSGGLDQAHAIAVDLLGNVFVTGSSWGIEFGDDFATVKYSAPNQPPTADAGSDVTVEATGESTLVNLRGLATDVDDPTDSLVFRWRVDGEVIGEGASPTVNLPPGTHRLILAVIDPHGAVGRDSTEVSVLYSWSGLVAASEAKVGDPVSLRFRLTGASASLKDCPARLFVRAPNGEEALVGSFRYREGSGNYALTWQTAGLAPGIHCLRVDLGDDERHVTSIRLRG